jgi:putative oxidoreductase
MSNDQKQVLRFGVLPLIARLSICCIFVQGAMGKMFGWSGQAAYMAQHRIPMIAPLLGMALVIEFLGVACLVIGFKARVAAFVMAVYLCIVSVMLHDFWSPSAGMMAQTEFLKNIGIVGGLLLVGVYGTGTFSLDESLQRRNILRERN